MPASPCGLVFQKLSQRAQSCQYASCFAVEVANSSAIGERANLPPTSFHKIRVWKREY